MTKYVAARPAVIDLIHSRGEVPIPQDARHAVYWRVEESETGQVVKYFAHSDRAESERLAKEYADHLNRQATAE